MTEQQMNWARGHDWFHSARKPRGKDFWIVSAVDTCTNKLVEFNNLTDLREWAGY